MASERLRQKQSSKNEAVGEECSRLRASSGTLPSPMHDDERSIRPETLSDRSATDRPAASASAADGLTAPPDKLPLELLRAKRRELLAELREVDGKIRALEEKTEQPPQRERVAMHVQEVLEEQESASASDLVRAVLRRDNRLHAGTVRAYISSLRRDGRLRAVGGRGVPGDPLVLALPEEGGAAATSSTSGPTAENPKMPEARAPSAATDSSTTETEVVTAAVTVGAKSAV